MYVPAARTDTTNYGHSGDRQVVERLALIMYLYFTFHLIGMYSQVSNKLAFRCSIAFFQITYLGRYIVPVGLLGT